jgi:hypothetical protein
MMTVDFSDVVNAADICMRDLPCQPHFLAQAPSGALVESNACRNFSATV